MLYPQDPRAVSDSLSQCPTALVGPGQAGGHSVSHSAGWLYRATRGVTLAGEVGTGNIARIYAPGDPGPALGDPAQTALKSAGDPNFDPIWGIRSQGSVNCARGFCDCGAQDLRFRGVGGSRSGHALGDIYL